MTTTMTVSRVKLLLAYDGSGFHGFALQLNNVRTVASVLSQTLAAMFNTAPEIVCAGRTDSGVHAWGQVVHFDIEAELLARYDMKRLVRSLNRQLGAEVSVRGAEIVSHDFHARFSAKQRTYRYSILNASYEVPFLRSAQWWISDHLDVIAMNESCAVILGEHDFTTFCRKPKVGPVSESGASPISLVRRIESAKWTVHESDYGEILRFEIAGNAFCHQMVRSLVGYFVEIGKRRRTADDFMRALTAGDRSQGAPLAPSHGLCLWEVGY